MAERSFKNEVNKLRLGAGEEFRGEGILAVTKALLQSGVSYVSGYQGAPISHLVDVLADADDVLQELGIRFEASANEAAAAATLAASINYPLRGAATFKSTVGTNVASDALANLASSGVTGGALIIVGEDYGEGSSIMQERSHAFAMKSQIWLLDPRPNLPSIVRAVETGLRAVGGVEHAGDAGAAHPRLPCLRQLHRARQCTRRRSRSQDAMEHPVRDANRIVLPPASYLHEKEKIEKRWPAAVRFIEQHKLNEFFDGDAGDIGIVLQGGMYNTVLRALEVLGLADVYGDSRIPLYVLNVTYPLIDAELVRFCAGKKAILMVEEGQPEFIEQARQHHPAARRHPDPHRGQGHAADGRRVYRRRHEGRLAQVRGDLSARPARRANASPLAPSATVRTGWPRHGRGSQARCMAARPRSAPAVPSGRSSPR